MENKQTAVEQLIDCIPSATEIMDYIHDYQPDEKMLDNWLWERIYKDREWVKMEKEQMIEFANKVLDNTVGDYDGNIVILKPIEDIYNETFGKDNG